MTRTLLMACLAISLSACSHETITVNPPPPPVSWLQCEPMSENPDVERLEVFQFADGTTFYRAETVNQRDGKIARYIVSLRGAHMDCQNAMQRLRDYYAGQE